ncbi:MAG: tetratricopeptide repeat protein [Deltaproteobacteria bacterium]|nr:tetratricopeptide repeat protein [Deltaproteobacteria bacterium]
MKGASLSFRISLTLFVLATAATGARAASSAAEAELLQSQATLRYHMMDYKGAAELLERALKILPGDVSSLELLALTRRKLNDDAAAGRAYLVLLALVDEKHRPPYHFELATIQFAARRFDEAREHFERAAEGGFNPGTSHFFLGFIEFSAKAWEPARAAFVASLASPDGFTYEAVSRYYLAAAYEQLGKSSDAVHSYYAAASAPEGLTDSISNGIRENALKALDRLDHTNSFAFLSMLGQWDTNVQSTPSDAASPLPQSMRHSFKNVLSGLAGAASSPRKDLQFIPSVRFYTNYNWNPVARDFSFASFTPSGLALYRPYARLSIGMKAEGTYTLKNTLNATDLTAGNHYSGYSFTGDIGPLARYEVRPSLNLAAELTYRPKRYYQDASTTSQIRSGAGFFARASGELTQARLLNPTAYFSYEQDQTSGSDFRFHAVGLGVANAMRVLARLLVTASADVASIDYFATVNPQRRDLLFSFRAVAQYALIVHWSLTGDLGYLNNGSTIPETFSYSRFVTSLGATYEF